MFQKRRLCKTAPAGRPVWQRGCVHRGVLLVCMAVPLARGDGGDVPVTLIGGALGARGTIAGARASVPANVLIDLGSTTPLRVHEQTARMLGLDADPTAEVTLGELKLRGLRATHADARFLEELTRRHANELGEIPAVAILGLTAFGAQDVALDLVAGTLRLMPGGAPQAEEFKPGERVTVVPYTEAAGRIWLRARPPAGSDFNLQLVTLTCDTVVDAARAAELGAPGGDLETLQLGTLDLAREVALRPEPAPGGTPVRTDGAIGTCLLSNFRLTLLRDSRVAVLERLRPTRFPTEERAYFRARAARDADQVQAFLDAHADSRLANEAAETLLQLRLDDPNSAREAIVTAVRLRARGEAEEQRARTVIGLADAIISTQRPDRLGVAEAVLHVAQESAPRDMNARAGHDIQARLGYLALQRHDLKLARRCLLSAAFGLPRDPTVNLWLGELYERTGQVSRAWSRYLEAAIAREPPQEAFTALDRINRDPNFRGTFTLADAAELLEGRVPEFHPAETFKRSAGANATPPVRLVESFVSINHPPTLAAELAFDALAEYFAGTDVVLVTYHVALPLYDPLAVSAAVSRGLALDLESTPVTFFDGHTPVSAAGDDAAAPEVFAAYRAAAEASQRAPAEWKMGGAAEFRAGAFSGHIELHGPAASGDVRLHVLLCEKLVLAPGQNGAVLHRNVVRHGFSPSGGHPVAEAAGTRTVAFKLVLADFVAELQERLDHAPEDGTPRLRPTYVDPAACTIAAFLQDEESGAVLAARSFDVAVAKAGAP